ncbi:MAG TPA: hypothetical protein VK614_12540 [Allosphingosinicella sp.]|nr:hypothetical protein [Allosphingosinicella sp.]
MSAVPLTDPRRAQALRDALAQMAPWLAPEWAGLKQEGDFGAALYEIAARLAEHSTLRLDQTALRDKLAFLDTLDIAAPAPRAATVPIVFMLGEKRSAPVYAPPRVQIAAAGDQEPVIFETREAISISPARPLRLIAADPGADRIELAPPKVIAPPQPSPPPVTYRLVSAAEPEGTMLQLAQAVGLAAGDLLRIAGTAYRIAKRSGEIVTLLDPLEAPAAAGAAVEKVTRLDSFALRNLSEHHAYVGHKELLKLDGPATITLRLAPPSLARRLTQLDIAYELWGKPDGADSADWQPLRLLGGRDGDLQLGKDWEGTVEEVEAEGRKSRWLRLRLLTAIADTAPPDTRATSVALKVNSNAAPQPKEGSLSIVSAFYNGLPLPLTTAFLPFGPEPQRFDTFAVAAPEALSKKGATVQLAVTLGDASLGSLAATTGAPDRVYGVGRNGRLQAIRFDGTGPPRWRQLDRPPPASSGTGGGATPRLDSGSAFYAFQSQAGWPASDVVVVRDKEKILWTAALQVEAQTQSVTKWTAVPPPGDQPPDSFCVVHTTVEGTPTARLLAADAAGLLYMQTVDATGAAPQKWQTLTASIVSGQAPKAPLRLAPVTDGAGLVVALDSAGAVHRGKIGDQTVEWTELQTDGAADSKIQPAAVMHKGKVHVIVANLSSPTIAMLREGQPPLDPPSDEMAKLGKAFSLSCLPAQPQKPVLPLVAVVGATQAMLWSDPQRATLAPLPVNSHAGSICSVLAAPSSATGGRLILGAPDERLLHADIQDGTQTLPFSDFDAVAVDAGTGPDCLLVTNKWATIGISPLKFPSNLLIWVAPGTLKPDTSYVVMAPVAGGAGTGEIVPGEPKRMVLDAADIVTIAGDRLMIGGKLFAIQSVKEDEEKQKKEDGEKQKKEEKPETPDEAGENKKIRIATLYTDVPDKTLDYVTYRGGEKREFPEANQQRLLNFGEAALPDHVKQLEFDPPANPGKQTFTQPLTQPKGENWVLVDAAWSTAPADGHAGFTVQRDSIGAWTQVPLPRSSENPELAWDYFDGRGWRRLDRDFSDGTANFASSGIVRFTVPDDLSPTDVAGKQDYWIRARLVGGDYGRPSYVVQTTANRQSISVDRSTVNPPEIFSIEASYELQSYAAPQLVLTVNNLAPVDQTQAAAAAGAEFDLFEGLAAHTGDPAGLGRAIYLGLSRAPGVDPLSLYIDAADVGALALRLQAEVLRPEGWAPIVCDDGTAGLARPGLLQLFLATAPAQLPLFGCAAWWFRLRPLEPASAWAPIVNGLYLNAVAAEQAKSLRQEILGSSLGEPDQSYALAEAPVLPETLELRVRESLSDEEKAALTATDSGAVAFYADVEGEWIRWCATDSFVDQGGGARVFRLDPSSGEIRFGNGRDGKIPPAGRDSIRAVGYQAGGGSRGNVPAFAVDQLKTALESVELAINPVDAGEGADAPPEQRLAETAPARLRHATRALAPPDIEALATGSSPDVVRARCLPSRCCGIELVVAIRMAGERCPIPSRARREGIARNIAAAGWGALAPEAIRVRPPSYVHIRVEAVVIARSSGGVAQVENDVRTAIVDFLHPIDGGSGGLGWPFGRRPWPSDVQRVAMGVAGVDRVVDIVIAARDAGADLDRLGPDALVCADEDDISLVVQPPRSTR